MAEHFDFLIIGAGISGIGAACHLRQRFADSSFALLEAMDGFGGTWWTHRYPGARSDSDLFTYGYSFKPWRGRAIATADEIRDYLAEVIDENGLAPLIRYGHTVQAAHWSSEDKRWTLEVSRTGSDEVLTFTTGFLWICAGYYDHSQGYTPEWPTLKDFEGQVVHPQHWPPDLSYADKRVVVIGSGATATTLIPSLADAAAHVTMLQRSPTFFAAEPWEHPLEAQLRPLNLPDEWFHEIMRRAFIAKTDEVVRLAFAHPEDLRAHLIGETRARLPEGFDVDKHFNPRYRPWQQRIANVPDGDLFHAIRDGKASVVTDTIERFDTRGIQLASGERLDADIIVTATGFNMQLFGGIPFSVDGAPVDMHERVTYLGMMIEGMPNMAYTQGYFRSSWTLRSDLVCDWVCRLVAHMREQGHSVVQPTVPSADVGMQRLSWIEADNFNAGYVVRSLGAMYGQGDRHPWKHGMEHAEERITLPAASPLDTALAYR
ncbi:flavin-containing monooxygenase [Variovorax boronicumulans]|uniref:flavin-containing monooxygenase n=1 Tax=Variovorax boronicumulans TaxID=436515 RepID=UPI00085BF83F|nr:NAD(P)/FAD-dependent oxidoreductase [Variovorax boronicumulans]OEZ27407.1 FAD-containing monooxygenase EthA [Variovorax boronicumulans]